MRRIFSAVFLWIAMLCAGLSAPAAEVPENLYLVGHLPSGVWNSNSCVQGEKAGDKFYFRNVSFNHSDNWNQASFGFITQTGINPINPSDYFYSSRPDDERDGHADVAVSRDDRDIAMYKSYANSNNERKNGWVLPDKGTYDFTVDFTDAGSPKLSICIRTDDGNEGGDSGSTGNLDDYTGGGHPAEGFWIRIGGNGNPVKKFNQNGNEYTIDISSSEIGIGNWFKISTEDEWWSQNYGYPDSTEGLSLPFALTPQCQGMNNNFICQDWGDFTIKFYYHGPNVPTPVYFLPRNYEGDMPGIVMPKPTGMSGTLPILYINVYTGGEDSPRTTLDNEIIDPNLRHKTYFKNAEYWLDKNGCDWMPGDNLGSAEAPLALDIKGRGNWTLRGFVKKPFKLKLDKKQSMLGLSKSKHFALLAHADDNAGYLRNFVGFNLGKRIGLPWTPSQQPVEVVINGNYRGLYFLTESIRVEGDRIDIVEGEDNDPDMANATGGYLIEFDNYQDDAVWQRGDGNAVWHDGHNFPVYLTPDTPEEYSGVQQTFITEQFNKMHDLVGGHNPELWSYLDLDDAVRYYLVEEIISHYESYHGSTYLFRDRGEGQKWHFSPLWDCGHAFEGGTRNFFYDSPKSMGNTWIRCLKDTPGFDDKLKSTWRWFMSQKYEGLFADIDNYCNSIASAARADRERWKDAGRPQYTDGWEAWEVQDNSNMESRRNDVKNQLNAKIEWLKGQWGDYSNGNYPEPERDATPAAELDWKYKDALPKDYVWHESFLNAIESTHNYGDSNIIKLGNIYNGAHASLDIPVVTFTDTHGGFSAGDAHVNVSDNGEVTLTVPVPSVYQVTLTMNEHKENGKTYKKSTLTQQVTVKPTFKEFKMKESEINTDNNVITLWTGQPRGIKIWSPFGGDAYDNPGFDELYYRVHYADGRNQIPARAASEYPYDMTKYDKDAGIDLNYADGLEMAVKVNGATSDKHDFTFSFAGGGIVTGVEDIGSDPDDSDVRYFDLGGVEIKTPTAPGVYIRVSRGEAAKVTVK